MKPIYIKCIKCNEDKYTNPEAFKKRIEKFGSEKILRAKYLCRKCREND